MQQMIDHHGLRIAEPLVRFLEEEALPGTGLEVDRFWRGVSAIFARLAPENRRLLAIRDALQARIDAAPGRSGDPAFLREIGYLVDEPGPFTIDPENVDDEVARIAGPQLVVPVLNARFLLNAANARWGSLYDALYGTDALPGKAQGPGYDAARGAQVIARARGLARRDLAGVGDCGRRAAIIRRWSRARTARSCSGTTGSISSSSSIPGSRSAARIRSASPTSCWNRRSPRSSISRTASRRWMPRTRSPPIATGSA